MRKKIVAGNWKMNNNKQETAELIESLKLFSFSTDVRVMIAPAHTHLVQAEKLTQGGPIEVLAQNMNASESGAYTGEISAGMLKVSILIKLFWDTQSAELIIMKLILS